MFGKLFKKFPSEEISIGLKSISNAEIYFERKVSRKIRPIITEINISERTNEATKMMGSVFLKERLSIPNIIFKDLNRKGVGGGGLGDLVDLSLRAICYVSMATTKP